MSIKIAPSILSADFGRLNAEIKEVEPYADLIHVDVMDGDFVDNITIGPVVVKHIKTSLPLDCHLMIRDPVKYAPAFAEYCQMISFHAELFEEDPNALKEATLKIKKLGVKLGLTLNPDKPLSLIEPVLHLTDYILIMSVYAGQAGQKFIPEVLEKITLLRKNGYKKDIEIDGGIDPETAPLALDAGASILVAGSSIFGRSNRKVAIQQIRGKH